MIITTITAIKNLIVQAPDQTIQGPILYTLTTVIQLEEHIFLIA